MSARRLIVVVFACLCGLLGGLALSGASALAARGHLFGGTIGAPGAGDGDLSEPTGVAVSDQSGAVFVADKGNGRVEIFGPTGDFIGQFNGSGLISGEGSESPAGQFVSPDAIAVDNSCALHKPALSESSTPKCSEFDPSYGDVYVVDSGHDVIDKYRPTEATAEYIGQITGSGNGAFQELDGLATDARGVVWVYQPSGEIDSFSNELTNAFQSSRNSQAAGFAQVGFAVDATGTIYAVHKFEGLAAKLNSAGEVLEEQLGSEGVNGIASELSSNDVYLSGAARVERFSVNGHLLETLHDEHLVGGSGVGVSASSETVYVTDAVNDTVVVFSAEAPSTPTVESESVTNVAAESATIDAEINPRGSSTEYRVEYGPCATVTACAGSPYTASLPDPEGMIGGSFVVQSISVHPQDLRAGTVYHFRVAAHNVHNAGGVTEGEEKTFTTQRPAESFTLPDGRAWDLVSPVDKHGALIETIGEGQVTQAALLGNAMTYVAAGPTSSEPEGNSNKVQVLSTRGPQGWESRDIAPPHEVATGLSQSTGQEYRAFSEDLAQSVVQPFGPFIPASSPQALSPTEASEQTPFLRTDFPSSEINAACSTSCYRPLVTGKAGFANVPEGTVFGATGEGGNPCPPAVICGPRFKGATPDLSHVVLEAGGALTSTALVDTGLYEWFGGKLELINQLTDHTVIGNQPQLGHLDRVVRHAISNDGSRVVFSEHGGEEHLYLRDMARGETVQLDAVQGGTGENAPKAAFQLASSDGSKVFFTDGQRLTPDSGGGPSTAYKENDLYECEIVVSGGVLTCDLTDLTPLSSKSESADVLDEVLGASEDGSYIYFVANGALTEDSTRGTCNGVGSKEGASCNLYVAHNDGSGWEIGLIGVLSAEDFPDWNGDTSADYLSNMTARVSPNGRWLAFMSQRGLSGNDTRDATTGQPDEEVYLYSADSEHVVCASCDPTGARPSGVEYKDLRYGLDGLEVWHPNQRLAASVPAWTAYTATGEALYQSRYLSNSGRLFFNANSGLVPQDTNRTGDVYEFEPVGVPNGAHACSETSATFNERAGGCVNLISSGTSSEESSFLDASADGSDVFFLTGSPLVGQDTDTSMDVYDAHECTGSSPCFSSAASSGAACSTPDACKAAPEPQPSIFGAPASSTFSGAGNIVPFGKVPPKPLTRAQKLAKALKACQKKPKKRRAGCQRQARRAYGPVHKGKKSRKGRGK